MAKLTSKAYTDNMLFGASETNPIFTPNPIGQYASGVGITPTLDPELLLAEASGGITKMTQQVSTGNYILPPGSEFAALKYSDGYYIKMILENGILEYSSNQPYYVNSFVRSVSGTKLYRSKIDNNVGQPLTNTASWEELELLRLRNASTTQQGTVQMGTGSTSNIVIDATRTAALYAPKVSPAFTGTPVAPTATAGTNTTQIGTTAFTTTALANWKNPTELGEIRTFKYKAGDMPPVIKTFSNGVKAYLFNGQTLTQANAPVLFADRGWTGSVVLENRQGRVSIQMGAGYLIGTTGGEAKVTLTKTELPNYQLSTQNGASSFWVSGGTTTGIAFPNSGSAVGSSALFTGGGGQPHNNMQPYIVDAIYLLAW